MSDEISYKITGSAAGLITEFHNLHKECTKVVGDLVETAKGAKRYGETHAASLKDVEQQMGKLDAAAVRVKKTLETPSDKFNAALRELNALHRLGKLSADEYAAAVAKEKAALEDASSEAIDARVAMDKLHQASLKWKKEVESPASAHKKNLQELQVLYRMGKLSITEYAAAVKLSEQAMKSATSSGTAGLSEMLGKLTDVTAGFVGVGSVIGGMVLAVNVIKREYQNLVDQQKSAADRQIDTATAQREALRNKGNDPNLSDDAFVKWAEETAKATGASQKSVYQAASAAFSFKGDLSNTQAMESVKVATEMSPDDLQAAQSNTIAIMNLMNRDPNAKARDIAGAFLTAKQFSPTVTDQAFAENVAPGIAEGMGFGDTFQESAALRNTFGTSMGDVEGRVTRTAALNLEQQLAESMPGVQGGTIARLKALQTPEFSDLRHKLLGAFDDKKASAEKAGLTGEAKAFIPMMELVKGDQNSRVNQILQSNLANLPAIEGSAKFLDESQSRLMQQPLQQSADLQRRLKGGTETLQIGNVQGGRQSLTRESLQDLLKNAGYDTATQNIALAEFEANTLLGGEDPVRHLGTKLKRLAGGKLATSQISDSAPDIYGAGGAVEIVPRTPSAEDLRVGGELDRLSSVLLKFVENQDRLVAEQNRLLAEQNQMLLDGQPASPKKPDATPPGKVPSADRQKSGRP